MKRQRNEPQKTAAEAYRDAATEIEVQMEALADAIERHHTAQQAAPKNWGAVGDLGHVRELLGQLIAFLPKKG